MALHRRSPSALTRAVASARAASILEANREAVSAACASTSDDEAFVAVVRGDFRFGGIWPTPRTELEAVVSGFEDIGWCYVFEPGTTAEDVSKRCQSMQRLATKRAGLLLARPRR